MIPVFKQREGRFHVFSVSPDAEAWHDPFPYVRDAVADTIDNLREPSCSCYLCENKIAVVCHPNDCQCKRCNHIVVLPPNAYDFIRGLHSLLSVEKINLPEGK